MRHSLQSTIRDLRLRRGRERRGLALAEGVRLVEEVIAAGIPIRGAATSPALETTRRGQALKAALAASGVEEVTDAELAELADTEHPQGVVAVIEPKRWTLDDIAPDAKHPLLVLDALQDPGNVGTILRTALALGASGVVALKGTAELLNPKVVRGSMGALFRLPSVSTDPEAFLPWARARGVELWVADAAGDALIRSRARGTGAPIALVVGNEGAGVGPELTAAATRRVSIPLAGGVESLNAAVAAAILLYEITRAD